MNGVVAVSVVAYLVLLGLSAWLVEECQREMAASIVSKKQSIG